jgi:hypothetical protein
LKWAGRCLYHLKLEIEVIPPELKKKALDNRIDVFTPLDSGRLQFMK